MESVWESESRREFFTFDFHFVHKTLTQYVYSYINISHDNWKDSFSLIY